MISTEPMIQSFISSTLTVMKTMCGDMGISHEIVTDQTGSIKNDIIGVMGISGNIAGTIILAFPVEIATLVVTQMTGYEPEELSEADINDGVSEVLNMICGNAKSQSTNTPISFSLSLPTIISSAEYKIGYHHDTEVVCVRFDVHGDSFYLYVSFKQLASETDQIIAVETNANSNV